MERRDEQPELAGYVRKLRVARGLSIRELGRIAVVDPTTVSRLERGLIESPDQRTLRGLAEALQVDVADLYSLAGYETGDRLPALQPYLRAKYDLSVDEIDQLAAYFDLIKERHERQRGDEHDNASYPNVA